jgi:hypothetical protein
MNITKIKRILAEKGIGSPLNRLMYTAEEIRQMKLEHPIIPKKRKTVYKKGITITNGYFIMDKRFVSRESAERFRLWNYQKNPSPWRVIEIK